MVLDPDVAGELGRYLTALESDLEAVRSELGAVRAATRAESIEADLLAQLTVEEQAALEPFLQNADAAELRARRDLLAKQRDVLVKATGILRARLG